MPLTNDINRWEYDADGVTTDFAYENLIFAASDLEVYFDEVLQVSGIAVSGIGVEDGGNVTPTPVVPDGVKVVIVRAVPFTQPQDFVDNEAVDAQAFEDGLNRMTILAQQIRDTIGRQATLPTAEAAGADMTVPALAGRLGQYWGWDAIAGSLVGFAAPAGTTAVSVFMAGVITAADDAAARAELDAATEGYKPSESSPAAMTADVGAGAFFNSLTKALVTNGLQTTDPITAPSVNPRNDIVYIDRLTGVVGVETGQEAVSPVDPVLSDGKQPVMRLPLLTSTATIIDSLIEDIRELNLLGSPGGEHIQGQQFTAFDDSGAADAYVITPAPGITAYAKYQTWVVDIANANTGASTMDVNEVGARNIFDYRTGAALIGGEIIAGLHTFVDDGTQLILMNPYNAGITLETEQATTSGSSFTFGGIPPGVKRIHFMFEEVSLDDTDNFLIQIGDAGGIETSGYIATGSDDAGVTVSSTAGFLVLMADAAGALSGHMVLTLFNASTFTWIASHIGKKLTGGAGSSFGGGSKSLSAELTQLTLIDTGGDDFDAGAVNIQYEF